MTEDINSVKNASKAYIYAFTAVLLWSTVATAFKISLFYVNFLELLFYSSGISLAVLLAIVAIQKKVRLLRCNKKEILTSLLLGFLNPFLYYIVLFKAYSLLPAQEAQPLNYTWPLILVLLSIPILKQKIGIKSIIGIIISFFGVVIIGTRGNLLSLTFPNPSGVFLAVGSSVIWGLFWIYNIKDKRDEVIKLFFNFLFGFVFIAITIVLFSKITFPPVKGILGVTYVGFFEMGITFVLWLKALSLAKTTDKVSNLVFLSPFISLIFINCIVGEKILFSTISGLIFIISGIIVSKL